MATLAERRHFVHDNRPCYDGHVGSCVADAMDPWRPQSEALVDRIDHARLLSDHEYRLQAVCGKFQEVDTYHRGLITMAGFRKAIEALGLRSGQKEVDDVLQYCTVLDDGWVMYKDLLHVISPDKHRAQRSSANLSIFPREPSETQCTPRLEEDLPLAERVDDVRRVFTRWERGSLSDIGFRQHLRGMGIEPTAELDRLLKEFGPSRAMPFGKLMYALQAEQNDGRRARTGGAGGRCDDVAVAGRGWQHVGGVGAHGASLREVICAFVDGQLPAVAFRQQLRRHGVELQSLPEVERLVRTHESDNNVRFGDFARVLMRQHPALDMSGVAGAAVPGELESVAGEGSAASSARAASAAGYPEAGHGGASALCPPFAAGGDWLEDVSARPGGGASSAHRGLGSQRGSCQSSCLGLGSQRGSCQSTCRGEGQPPAAASQRSRSSGSATPGRGTDPAARRAAAGSLPLGSSPPWQQAQPEQRQQRSRPSSASRLQGGSGNILSWEDQRAPAAPPLRGPPQDFLHWGDSVALTTPSSSVGCGREGRAGKRFFSLGPPAGQRAPFGREADVDGPSATPMGSTSAPFGTDNDYRLSRPEDAGTNEYRTSAGVRRGGVMR